MDSSLLETMVAFDRRALDVLREIKPQQDDCWIWSLGSFNASRYPVFRRQRVNRLSYLWSGRSFVDHQPLILHTCDMKWCWNYHHLFAGDESQNQHDRWNRNISHQAKLCQ